jgi:hypothetical protein
VLHVHLKEAHAQRQCMHDRCCAATAHSCAPPVKRPHRGWSCCAALSVSCGVAGHRRHLTWQRLGGACCRGPSRPWLLATVAVCVAVCSLCMGVVLSTVSKLLPAAWQPVSCERHSVLGKPTAEVLLASNVHGHACLQV